MTSKDSELSASETLMSSHAMKMGLYTINLGTSFGQKLHTLHMLILPLIPVFILLGQNTSAFLGYIDDSSELSDVKTQIGNAVDLSILVQRLQEERAAVALSSFLNRTDGVETMADLQPYALNGLDIASYTLLRVCIMLYRVVYYPNFVWFQTFNATDTVLKNVVIWPTITLVSFFESKLTFQIQHSIFRTKVRFKFFVFFTFTDTYFLRYEKEQRVFSRC